MTAVPSAEDGAQHRHDLGPVLDARVVGGEARIGEEVVPSEGGAQPLEEGIGEAGDDEVAVAGGKRLVGHQVGVPAAELAVPLAVRQHVVAGLRAGGGDGRYSSRRPPAGVPAGGANRVKERVVYCCGEKLIQNNVQNNYLKV